MSFLTSLLPGLRQLRTPLAGGLVWLFAGWLAFAPAVPDRATATGVIADLYRLSAAVGKVPTLAGAAFTAFLVGVLSVRISEGLADAASGIGDRFARELVRPEIVDRLFAVTPGASIKRRQLAALRHAVMHRLLDRYRWDEQFQQQIADRITALYDAADADDHQLPEPFRSRTRDQLVADLVDRPNVRVQALWTLIDLDRHAKELTWETHFVDSAAAATPEVLDERDRAIAEAEFRSSMALPMAALIIATAHRTSGWILILIIAPLWMVFLSGEQYGEADNTVLRAVIRGSLDWPALDYLDSARVHYRPFAGMTRPPWSRTMRRTTQ